MSGRTWTSWPGLLLALGLLLGNAGRAHAAPCGIAFVADDAGGVQEFSDGVRRAVHNSHLPLMVVQLRWSATDAREDMTNRRHQLEEGRKLAARVISIHCTQPGTPIYLVGFGAGASVVLAAGECLPPGSICRIILFSPNVSCSYDLRRALIASCEGIDNYFSNFDTCLQHATRWHGTCDRSRERAAGLVGFHPQLECARDAYIYHTRLRQHRLDMNNNPTHNGGHVDYARCDFLQASLITIFRCSLGCPAAASNKR